MIFYFNRSGELISYIPNTIYQGSNQVNTIYFICPVVSGSTVGISFTLPNGSSVARQQMSLASNLDSSVVDAYGNYFSAYSYKVPFSVTKDFGTLICQFCIYTPNDSEVLTTESVNLVIERGVYHESAEIADPVNLALDYNYNEKNTGAKWLNSSMIYRKSAIITLTGTVGVVGSYTISNSIKPNFVKIVSIEGNCDFTVNSVDYTIPLNCYYPANALFTGSAESYIYIINDDNYIYIKYKLPCASVNCNIVMLYTKE